MLCPPLKEASCYAVHLLTTAMLKEQLLGGASDALISDGIERFSRLAAGPPERLLVMRDHTRQNNKISQTNPMLPSKDPSINFVPVAYSALSTRHHQDETIAA